MKKYQQLAEQLREQIASGIWQPGDRLPSLRDQVALSGMSFMTVSHAYVVHCFRMFYVFSFEIRSCLRIYLPCPKRERR